ncbi:MAG: CDP-diacylglycerol--glycerol-3-phosphate 3-phosphatidyltransferase [Candidatus Omnitrophica bacterium]|nr:CDP-diacylglycerol--glycerol-3-phosphate 3-phosphatidyltransferase [Candidatus Omnitrophota bacterium]
MITPNRLTLFRIALAISCPILLIRFRTPTADIGVILLFILACLTDWWDGHLARQKALVTSIGKILDPIADKLLILGLLVSFVQLGLYSVEWILTILIREVVVTIVRLVKLGKRMVISAEWAGKLKVGFQIGSISATLLYLSFMDSGFFSNSSKFIAMFQALHYLGIILANVFTIGSGISFFKHLDEHA